MTRKTAAQVLREVSPELTVIPGGMRHHVPRKKAIKLEEVSHIELPVYIPRRMTTPDWEKAGGEICPVCRKEAVQLFPYGFTGKRKACKECIERRRRLLEYKSRLATFHRQAEMERRKRLRLIS